MYNVVLDSAMVRLGGWTLVVAAAALAVIVIACAVLAWLI